jgi:hypothetical protein
MNLARPTDESGVPNRCWTMCPYYIRLRSLSSQDTRLSSAGWNLLNGAETKEMPAAWHDGKGSRGQGDASRRWHDGNGEQSQGDASLPTPNSQQVFCRGPRRGMTRCGAGLTATGRGSFGLNLVLHSSPAPLTPDKGGARVALDIIIVCNLPPGVNEVNEKCHSYASFIISILRFNIKETH